MKHLNLLKSTLLLFALVVGSTSVWAQTETIVLSEQGYTNAQAVSSTAGNIILLSYTDGSTATAYYTTGNGVRVYYGGKMTVSAGGLKITKVIVTFGKDKSPTISMTSNGTTTSGGTATPATWIGEATEVYFNVSDKGHARISQVEVWCNTPASFAAGKTMISFSNANVALDLTDANRPAGLKAYKVSVANASSVTLTEVTEAVAKNTGLILTGTAGETYNIPVIGSGTDISASNLLVAANGTDNVTSAYVLSDGKFHPVAAAGVVIPAGKAYLPAGSLSAHELDITFDNGDVTGIEAVETQKAFNGAFYNLAGQRVAQPAKGLYIVNGKKVVLK